MPNFNLPNSLSLVRVKPEDTRDELNFPFTEAATKSSNTETRNIEPLQNHLLCKYGRKTVLIQILLKLKCRLFFVAHMKQEDTRDNGTGCVYKIEETMDANAGPEINGMLALHLA